MRAFYFRVNTLWSYRRSIMMTSVDMNFVESCGYELRFESLFQEGRALSFPCDSSGNVIFDALSERARHNYFFARTVVGREYASPAIMQLEEVH
jgi:hypothetical protein